jgi:hypothetical protein
MTLERGENGRFKPRAGVEGAPEVAAPVSSSNLDPLSLEMAESLPDVPQPAPKTPAKADAVIVPDTAPLEASGVDKKPAKSGVPLGAVGLFALGVVAFVVSAGRAS